MDVSHLFNNIFQAQNFAEPNILFVFGVFLTLGVFGAILAHNLRMLPTITAFMFLGAVIGPCGIGLIDANLLQESRILIDVALGLILYKLGCEVQLRHLLRTTSIWRVSVTEAVLTFGAVFLAMKFFGGNILICLIVGAIAISSSPAILVHMSEEMQAKGPVIHQAKALLTLNNIFSFFAFSLFLPFALGEGNFSWFDIIGIPLYRAIGAVIIGSAVAFIVTQIDRMLDKNEEHFRFALIIGGITVTLGLTSMFQISSLFASLTLGIVTRWLETKRQGLSTVEFGSSSDVFFIVLFVMAGANFHIPDLFQIGGIALVLVLARFAAKTLSLHLNQNTSQLDKKFVLPLSLMLTPLGALAIGLTQTLKDFSPEIGSEVLTIVFAMVAIMETIGPFAVSAAIRITGESPFHRNAVATPIQENELQKEAGLETDVIQQ